MAAPDRAQVRAPSRSYPATKLFAAITLLVYAGQAYVEWKRDGRVGLGGIQQADFLRFGGLPFHMDTVAHEPWRLLSAVFVHIGLLHIAFNMFGLIDLGRLAEPLVGSARFVVAYVVTGIGGFATTLALSLVTPQGMGTAGASGALFGVMGLILGFLLRRRDPRWRDFLMHAVVFSVLFGFGINAMKTGVTINNSAHLGGLGFGVLFGVLFGGARRPGADRWMNVAAVVSLVLCGASLVLCQLSNRWRYEQWEFFSHAVPSSPTPSAAPNPRERAAEAPRLIASTGSTV